MKHTRYTQIAKSILLLAVAIIPFAAMAQDPGGGPDAPIDGGLSLLLAAGVGYGVKKYRAGRKKDEAEK